LHYWSGIIFSDFDFIIITITNAEKSIIFLGRTAVRPNNSPLKIGKLNN
jgi:hypothetical protein